MPTTNTKRQRNSQGNTSRSQIIQAAEQVLKRDGYHSLTTRKVAQSCAISLGNLTYHFPNKTLLIEAIMAQVCERYQSQRSVVRLSDQLTPVDYVRRCITWMLNDAVDPDTSALFLELWILAKHHDFGSQIIEDFYATATTWIEQTLATHFPATQQKQREQAAYFILTLSEGAVPVFSRQVQRKVKVHDMIEYGVAAVLTMLEGCPKAV
jgi:AcrR family transcriptional regulator